MIHFYYTADYELYLGGHALPPDQVLIHPTGRLLDLCDTLSIPLTLFVDVACLWQYRQWGEEGFVAAAEEQLRQAVARGHDVQAHLHPHWPHTRRQGGGYHFPDHCYALGTLAATEDACRQQATALLQQAVGYLEGLLQPVRADYRCRAFRAGGYRLDPRRQMVVAVLRENGFLVDSSIVPGYVTAQGVDFRHEPVQAGYWLSQEGAGLYEVPIAASRLRRGQAWRLLWRQALVRGLRTMAGLPEPHRGEPWSGAPQDAAPAVSRFRLAYWHWRGVMDRRFARLDLGDNPQLLLAVVQGFLEHQPEQGHLALLCHPKGLYPPQLRALQRFHQGLRQRYGAALDCSTFSRLAHGLSTGEGRHAVL